MDAVLGRHRLAVVLALALAAGACGNHGGTPNSTTGTTLEANGTTSSTNAGGSNATPPTTTGSGAHRGGGSTATTSSAAPGGNAIADAASAAPGAFAGVLLAAGPAHSITVDVLAQSGETPNASVLTTLRQILAASSGKPVAVHGPATLRVSTTTHDADEIRRLADEQGMPQGANGTAVIHLLYLKGSFTDNSVLGITVRADTTAVFPDQIVASSSPLAPPQRLEQAVDTHELGHVLGLVDLYLDDNRDDPKHPGHSTNPHSVMYWAVESDLVSQVLGGPPPVDFDAADQSDLQKIHAGAAAAPGH